MFREDHGLAWMFHRNTSRWPFNMHGLASPDSRVPPFKEHLDAPMIELPPAELPNAGFADLIAGRHSCRQFRPSPLPLQSLSTILHAAYGVQGESSEFGGFLDRTVPSGGALYPLELYALCQRVEGVDAGVIHYLPLVHGAEVVHPEPLPQLMVAEMFLGQPYLANAAAVLVIAAVVERSMWKYEDRGYRYIMLEAGHVAQNAILCATALGLGTLPLGGFFDDDVSGLIRLDRERDIALYGVAIGHRATDERNAARTPDEGGAMFRRY